VKESASIDKTLRCSVEALASQYLDVLNDVVGYEGESVTEESRLSFSFRPDQPMTCIVGFTGVSRGFFSIATHCEAIGPILGMAREQFASQEAFEDECSALLAELLNGVAGGLFTLLDDESELVTLLPPSVFFGRFNFAKARCCQMKVRCEGFELVFTTCLDTMRLDAVSAYHDLKIRYEALLAEPRAS